MTQEGLRILCSELARRLGATRPDGSSLLEELQEAVEQYGDECWLNGKDTITRGRCSGPPVFNLKGSLADAAVIESLDRAETCGCLAGNAIDCDRMSHPDAEEDAMCGCGRCHDI